PAWAPCRPPSSRACAARPRRRGCAPAAAQSRAGRRCSRPSATHRFRARAAGAWQNFPMPSFDAVLEPNQVEIRNAVDQAGKEIGTRFDFKGTSARAELGDKGKEITLFGDSDFQIEQVADILVAKLTRRGVDIRFLDRSAKVEKIGGDKVKQVV